MITSSGSEMLDLAMVLSDLRNMPVASVGAYDILKIGYDANNGQLVALGRSRRDYAIGIGVFVGCDGMLAWSYGHYHDDLMDALGEFDNRNSRLMWFKD